ncbi:MAG: dTDP-glucose 4,6-dehydratase [Candidatus Omnitrophota bacterium]|nr:MAG: dTDP-glucose 4,6-dehydratase [Candidatus Omnitrophota bacterium]
MKILVTGGSGFIGSNFVLYMLKEHKNYQIINFDKLTYAGNPDNLKTAIGNPDYQFVRGDICCCRDIEKVMQNENIDYVVHFAAESHVDRSISGPEIFTNTNVLGTQILLETVKKYQVKRFIHISTDEVYGSIEQGRFRETTPLAPNSPYSASKAASDFFVRAYYKTFGLPAIITRCSNNYGSYQFPEKLIPLMITNALQDKPLPVYGNGENVRDWLYVLDHCSAIDKVLHYGKVGEVYNIGGNNEWTNIAVIKLILEQLNKPESLIEFVQDRAGHDQRYAIDAAKIKDELGWQPLVDFSSGIKKTINWYIENTEWIQRIKTGQYQQGNDLSSYQ